MKVGVVYASPKRQAWVHIDVPEGSTIQQAIERSGILRQFPEIDLTKQKIGVFGKVVTLESAVEDGARIEIYRPITADPKALQKQKKAAAPAAQS